MKTKVREIKHPSGEVLRTPLLIPSFSSKGFGMKDKSLSEITDYLLLTREILSDYILISAFDIYNGLIPKPEAFASTRITFIDSGGYETSPNYDLSNIMHYPQNIEIINNWQQGKLIEVIRKWPEEYSAIIVNFDNFTYKKSTEQQINDAINFFKCFEKNKFLFNFLIKPESNHFVNIDKLIENLPELANFDILGLTDKELGSSVLEKMQKIFLLRESLDNNNISIPIHIFGCLDPITCILYYLAGAEIFDGLTWLRYSYFDGIAIYPMNYGILNIGIHEKEKNIKFKSILDNTYFLSKLEFILRDFHETKSFKLFDELGNKELSNKIQYSFSTFENSIKH